MNLKTPISEISGIGKIKQNYFKKIGIEKIEDLLFHFPRKYINLKKIKKISDLKESETVTVKGNVLAKEVKRIPGKTEYLKVAVSDNTGILYVIFFNQIYLKEIFQSGKTFIFYGKVEFFNNEIEMVNPIYEEYEKGGC